MMVDAGKGLHELVSSPCPLCGGVETEDVWQYPGGIVNGICTACGHVYLTRRYPDQVIAESYQDYGQCYRDEYLADEKNLLFAVARKRLDFLRKHISEDHFQSVLEIGCGYGHFLKVMEGAKLKVGIEPSSAQASFARSFFNIENIIEGTYETALPISSKNSQVKFDLICSFHVIEHLVDPANFLKKVHEQLRPDGYLYLALPDLFRLSPDLIELYYIYKNWHLHSFSEFTIERMLQIHGFKLLAVKKVESTEMHPSDLVVLAQKSDISPSRQSNIKIVEKNFFAASKFHQTLNDSLANLRAAFSGWYATRKRCAVYGAGIHTQALLELAVIDLGPIKAIIDDDPGKVGGELFGIPIVGCSDLEKKRFDVIIVSSLAAEKNILQRLGSMGLPPSIEIKGIYRDYMTQRV